MKVLGIESSSLVASAAILQDDVILAEYTVNYKKTHSQTLLPMLDEILRMTEQDLSTLDGIAVAEGPGSFTGLRIGSATAKGLGLALDLPLAAVPTVDAMACQLFGCAHRICPIMDAKRGQVYTGIYRFEEAFQVLQPAEALAIEDLFEQLGQEPGKVVFLGDGVPVFREKIRAALGAQALFAPAPAGRQRASAVAAFAVKLLGGDNTEYFRTGSPNSHVYETLERVHARRRAG